MIKKLVGLAVLFVAWYVIGYFLWVGLEYTLDGVVNMSRADDVVCGLCALYAAFITSQRIRKKLK